MGTDVPIFVADGEAPARRVKLSPYYLVIYTSWYLTNNWQLSSIDILELVSILIGSFHIMWKLLQLGLRMRILTKLLFEDIPFLRSSVITY